VFVEADAAARIVREGVHWKTFFSLFEGAEPEALAEDVDTMFIVKNVFAEIVIGTF